MQSTVPRLRAVILAIVVALTPAAIVAPAAQAQQTDAELAALGLEANLGWWGALVDRSLEVVDAILAPEFQIMRADGSGYDKPTYLASERPILAGIPEFHDMVVTRHGDTLVTRYTVTVEQTREGRPLQAEAPRLTVFRFDDGRWLVVAHANFAVLQ